jgi:hypothetical protein
LSLHVTWVGGTPFMEGVVKFLLVKQCFKLTTFSTKTLILYGFLPKLLVLAFKAFEGLLQLSLDVANGFKLC